MNNNLETACTPIKQCSLLPGSGKENTRRGETSSQKENGRHRSKQTPGRTLSLKRRTLRILPHGRFNETTNSLYSRRPRKGFFFLLQIICIAAS